MGLGSMQSQALIGIVERADDRGGIDTAARDEIMLVPHSNDGVSGDLSNRVRWLVFGVLFSWALLIAGLMQVVV